MLCSENRGSVAGDGTSQLVLPCTTPFHLEATVRVLQRRPTNRVDVWDWDRYLRVLTHGNGSLLVEVKNLGTIDAPDLRYCVLAGDPAVGPAVERTLRKMLGLDVDADPFERMARADPAVRATADALRGMRPPRFETLFETLANVVPFQQLSLNAGVAIVGRLVERFGTHLEYAGRSFYAFPTATAIADADPTALRACGLSMRKVEVLRNVARLIESGGLTEDHLERLTTNDALRALQELPGIGRWSAGLILLRGFRRLDVFPPGDVGAERNLRALAHLASGAPLCQLVDRFGNYRGFLYFFGLGGSLLEKGLIHPALGDSAVGVLRYPP